MRANCRAIFHQNSKLKVQAPKLQSNLVPSEKLFHNLSSKLMGLFILFFTLSFFIFSPVISEATYKIYLKNGRIIKRVNEVKEEAGQVRIYKNGIMLALPKTEVLKIEEYKIKTIEKEGDEEKTPAEKEPPEYLRYYDEGAQVKKRGDNSRELKWLKREYQLILNKLERLEALEKKSEELQREIHKKWSPRKARIARKEKAEVDKELESLRKEKDSLLKRKEELEAQIKP